MKSVRNLDNGENISHLLDGTDIRNILEIFPIYQTVETLSSR